MKRDRASIYLRFAAVFTLLGVLGVGAVVYVLVHERFTLPFANVYSIRAEFTAADGVLAGTGQPVLVAGVKVGQITGLRLVDGTAMATLQINRSQVPRVYANATAVLAPVSPLDDMSIDLDPGASPAPTLTQPIGIGNTTSPLNSEALLGSLDSDTRDYLSSLLTAAGEGLGNRGANLRRALIALGPTTQQLGEISQALAARRTELAHFVHNLGVVSYASAQDGQIPAAISAGNETLQAITSQDAALRQTLAELPGTMDEARSTLAAAKPFAQELGPTLTALTPAVEQLPATLRDADTFARKAVPVFRDVLRPTIHASIPYVRMLAPATVDLARATPYIIGDLQSLNYFLNELDYEPSNGDQSLLFWMLWAFHDANSVASTADANGTIGRGLYFINCQGLEASEQLQSTFNLVDLCPK